MCADSADRKLERLESARKEISETATVARLALPSAEVTDKILRYETAIERQLYRGISELERLQERRTGEIHTMLFFALFAKRSQNG